MTHSLLDSSLLPRPIAGESSIIPAPPGSRATKPCWMVVEQDVKFGATTIPPVENVAASPRYLNKVVRQLDPPEPTR